MNYLGYDNWEVTDITEDSKSVRISANYLVPAEKCTSCKKPNAKLYRVGPKTKSIKDTPSWGKPTVIMLTRQKYHCLGCRQFFIFDPPELVGNKKMTPRLYDYIGKEAQHRSNADVGRTVGVSENTVREIAVCFSEKLQERRKMPPAEILGVDGVYILGREHTVFTDVKNRRFVDLKPGMNKHVVAKHLLDLKADYASSGKQPKAIVMDMSNTLYYAAKAVFPDAKIVIDRYHIQRMVKEAIDGLLKDNREVYQKNKKNSFLPQRFVLYRRRFRLKELRENLLDEWSRRIPDLKEIYNLKEEFLDIWEHTDRKAAEKAYEEWKAAIPASLEGYFANLIGTVGTWYEAIFNYFDYRYTNGYTEAVNRQIKERQTILRGESFEMMRSKMLCQALLKSDESEGFAPPHIIKRKTEPARSAQRKLRLKHVRENVSWTYIQLSAQKTCKPRFSSLIPLNGEGRQNEKYLNKRGKEAKPHFVAQCGSRWDEKQRQELLAIRVKSKNRASSAPGLFDH